MEACFSAPQKRTCVSPWGHNTIIYPEGKVGPILNQREGVLGVSEHPLVEERKTRTFIYALLVCTRGETFSPRGALSLGVLSFRGGKEGEILVLGSQGVGGGPPGRHREEGHFFGGLRMENETLPPGYGCLKRTWRSTPIVQGGIRKRKGRRISREGESTLSARISNREGVRGKL